MAPTAAAVKQRPPAAASIAAAVVSTLSWIVISSLLIVLNKALYLQGFNFPLLLTGMGQVSRDIVASFLWIPCLPLQATNYAEYKCSQTLH